MFSKINAIVHADYKDVPLIEQQKKQLKQITLVQKNFNRSLVVYSLAKSSASLIQNLFGIMGASLISRRFLVSSVGIDSSATTSITYYLSEFIKEVIGVLYTGKVTELVAVRETNKRLNSYLTAEYLSQFSPDIVDHVNQLQEKISEEISEENNVKVNLIKKTIEQIMLVLLSKPLFTKEIDYNPNLRNKVKNLVNSYSPDIQDDMRVLISQIIANSKVQSSEKIMAYLYGPPGTGKTRFVRNIAHLLNLPLIEIRCPAQGLSSLYGEVNDQFRSYYNPPSNSFLIGELPLKMINAGFTNPIIFIDEADITQENVNDYKQLLNNCKNELAIGGYPGSTIDFSRAVIILASNNRLTDEALLSRMPQFVFHKVFDKTLHDLANKKIDAAIINFLNAYSLTQQQTEALSIAKNLVTHLIQTNQKYDIDGLRVIDRLASPIVHFIGEMILDLAVNVDAENSIDESEIIQKAQIFIENKYARMQGRIDKESEVIEAPTSTLRQTSLINTKINGTNTTSNNSS